MPPSLMDTHCHLDFDHLQRNLPDVIARAEEAGVTRMVTIGCVDSVDTVDKALRIAQQDRDRFRASAGVHPHDASALFQTETGFNEPLIARLREVASDPQIVAIGEMGLDYYYDQSPREVQRQAFRRQIALAREVKKPIIIHTRDAAEETLQILRDEGARDVGGIIHCFSEGPEFARRALDLGFVSSFSGLVTFKRNVDAIREAAKLQPKDAILVETDAPFLAPVPFRGKKNEPSFVVHTATAIAELRGEDRDTFFAQTTANAERVYQWFAGGT